MAALNNYNFKRYNLIAWFFRLLVLFIATIIVLLCVLKINETITIKEGEIVAANPQEDYKAPLDAEIGLIKVKEGQPVKPGDTLLILKNSDYSEQMARTQTEIIYLQKKILSIETLQVVLQKKKSALEQTTAITDQKYQLDIKRLVHQMETLDDQYNLQRERLSAANEKFVGDSILLKKDMLSKYEFNNTKDANLALKENLSVLQNERSKQLSDKSLAYNSFTRELNSLLLNKTQLDENAEALVQAKNEYESQFIQAKETLAKLIGELNNMNIIARSAGIVNYLFSTKKSTNVIIKGELLISIAPQSISYYAKIFIPEKDMPSMKTGLAALLKMDAYQNFKHGIIYGKVSYISDRKEADKFYALVEISLAPKFKLRSGYAVYGEVIIERSPLYKFFIKKIFKRFENT